MQIRSGHPANSWVDPKTGERRLRGARIGSSEKMSCVLLSASSYQEAQDVDYPLTGDVDFDHWVKVVYAMFFHYNFTPCN